MPDEPEPQVQLSTHIAKTLKHRVKVHCIEREITIRDFVLAALEAKLKKTAAAE